MAKTVHGPSADVDDLSAAALSALTGATVLECLGKQPAPPTLAADLAHVLDLPPAIHDELWAVIEPNLGAINTPHTTRIVAAFCETHALDPRAVTPVIGACRFVFQRGAEHATAPDRVGDDLRRLLAPEKPDAAALEQIVESLVRFYARAARKLRLEAVHEALTDHGRVVTDVKWRVDTVSHANTGESINVPVTLLTLRYREGDQSGQVTVQLLPDELKKLQRACEQALR